MRLRACLRASCKRGDALGQNKSSGGESGFNAAKLTACGESGFNLIAHDAHDNSPHPSAGPGTVRQSLMMNASCAPP